MKTIKLGKALLVLFIFLWTFTAWAADSEIPEEEVVVTAARIEQTSLESPGLTEVINGDDFQNKDTSNVTQVLARNGQMVSTYGGASGTNNIRIDGGSSEQTLVLINGVPANTGCGGSADLGSLPAVAIERIEICHGPLSALYGANALGGVVNIITDLTGDPSSSISLLTGNYDTRSLGLTLQDERWGIALGGSMTEGHRERSQTDNAYLLGQYDFLQGTDEHLSLYWQYLNKDNQVPGPESSPYENAKQAEENSALNLNGKKFWLGGQWEYKIFGQSLDLKYDNDDPSYPEHDRHQTVVYGADLAGLYELGDHQLLGGVMLKEDRFESTVSGKNDQNSSGLFLQDSWNVRDGLKLITGLRWDQCSDYSSPVSPRVALVKSLAENISLKIGYGKAFRAPTINELYWNEPASGMYGNKDLKPEEGERYEVIQEWRQGSQAITVSFFQSYLTNGIRWDDPEGDYTYTAFNIDKLRTSGAGITWENSWREFFTCRLGYQWLDEKAWDETTESYSLDKNFFGVNRYSLGMALKYGPWQTGLNWKSVQDRIRQSGTKMPDYHTGSFDLGYQINDRLKIVLTVDNVTDERYAIYDGFPLPGRESQLVLNYRF
jgi:outer membrane cobalamin receptor